MIFDPATPNGQNRTIEGAVSADGTPAYGRVYTLPARTGVALRLTAGDTLSVINSEGTQVCDFWAFCTNNLREFLSMAHCHTALNSVMFRVGNTLVTNNRQDILRISRDTSAGVHDTVIAACDAERYRQLGVEGYHDNCTDNLRMALNAIGLAAPAIPAPFNIWMNIPIDRDGSTRWDPPVSQPGDEIDLKAIQDCIAVLSACPQDVTPVNGSGQLPVDLAFRVSLPNRDEQA
ncbi:MAG: urea carboxylase-associated family protein [Pseudomonadota bacterium]